jgi:biotin-dependent carboxylase-like uncharacterized protein
MSDGEPTLEILEPGLMTTIQDAGRPEATDIGVPVSGGCDPWSLAIANLLVDAEAGAPALEMTIAGPTIAVRHTAFIGIAGADLGGVVRETGRRLLPGRSWRVAAGTTLSFPGPPAAVDGARAYLALPTGIDAEVVLGSASTCLVAGFGGMGGRPIRRGDLLRPRADRTTGGQPVDGTLNERVWATEHDPVWGPDAVRAPIRVLEGPHLAALGGAAVMEALIRGEWTVGSSSDRIGLRLQGRPLTSPVGMETLSHGVVWGAVQLPPDGAPIVLLADHQTTGGYPVIAVAITADWPRLGQLRPGSAVRFVRTDVDAAVSELHRQRVALETGAAALREGAVWDDLWHSARG